MRKLGMLVAASLMMSGCAGTLGQLINRPITSDELDEVGEFSKLKTVSGDHRLVRVVMERERPDKLGYYYYDVCAETQADAIVTRNAGSALSIRANQTLSDVMTQGAQLTNNRSPISDVVRHLGWHLCNARLNQDLTPDEYREALVRLSYNAMVVLQQLALGDKHQLTNIVATGAAPMTLELTIPTVKVEGAAAAEPSGSTPKK